MYTVFLYKYSLLKQDPVHTGNKSKKWKNINAGYFQDKWTPVEVSVHSVTVKEIEKKINLFSLACIMSGDSKQKFAMHTVAITFFF